MYFTHRVPPRGSSLQANDVAAAKGSQLLVLVLSEAATSPKMKEIKNPGGKRR